MEASVIVTYRCPMHCQMCNIWDNPTDPKSEFTPELLSKLPQVNLVNVTGGEPTIREDLDEIIRVLFTRTRRVVISTSGWFEDRIFKLAERYPNLGFRVSIEGLSQKNDVLRGRQGGFDKGMHVLLGLRRMGIRDIGFGITVSNDNSEDMLWLYELAKNLNMQFATASFHNSFYFHKEDNVVTNVDEVCKNFEELMNRLIVDRHPKSWFRALFNLGLINYIRGNSRLLPCEAGSENFFIDPYGEVLACNGGAVPQSFGNLNEVDDFMRIWNSPYAEQIRRNVKNCPKSCWMIGSASPVIKKYKNKTIPWVLKARLKAFLGQRLSADCMPRWRI